MSTLAIFSTVTITLALIFYSAGIWAERISRYLKKIHILLFWTGFSFDVTGTFLMHLISDGQFNILDPHTLTGQLALWLMLGHAIWATVVVKKNNEKLRKKFHRYSLLVWFIWLIPYIGGMYMGMN